MSAIVREKLKALERKKAQLCRREAQLIKDRRNLLLRNALLSGWCEALSLLQISAFSEEDSSSVGGDAATEQFQLLLAQGGDWPVARADCQREALQLLHRCRPAAAGT